MTFKVDLVTCDECKRLLDAPTYRAPQSATEFEAAIAGLVNLQPWKDAAEQVTREHFAAHPEVIQELWEKFQKQRADEERDLGNEVRKKRWAREKNGIARLAEESGAVEERAAGRPSDRLLQLARVAATRPADFVMVSRSELRWLLDCVGDLGDALKPFAELLAGRLGEGDVVSQESLSLVRLQRVAASVEDLDGDLDVVSVNVKDLRAVLEQLGQHDEKAEASAYRYIFERCEELERMTGVRVVSHSAPPRFTVAAELRREFESRCAALRFAEAVAVVLAKAELLDGTEAVRATV